MSTPNPRTGHGLAVETLDVVRRFYESDEVSRVMPGRKDFVSEKLEDVFTYRRGWS